MLFNVLMIVFSSVYIIDISGVMDAVNKSVYKFIYGRNRRYDGSWFIPVLSCAKCSSFWLVLVYTLVAGVPFIACVFIACVASLSAVIMSLALSRLLRLFNRWLS